MALDDVGGPRPRIPAQLVDPAQEIAKPEVLFRLLEPRRRLEGRFEGEVSRAQALDWLQDALNDFGDHAAQHQQPLLFEPLNRYETNLFNCIGETAHFLQTLKTKNVKILADLYHMNIEEVSIADALRAAGPSIGHVHFADSNRRAIGFGHTEMRPVMEALRQIGYAGYLSAEILPLPDSEAAARQTMKAYRELAGA